METTNKPAFVIPTITNVATAIDAISANKATRTTLEDGVDISVSPAGLSTGGRVVFGKSFTAAHNVKSANVYTEEISGTLYAMVAVSNDKNSKLTPLSKDGASFVNTSDRPGFDNDSVIAALTTETSKSTPFLPIGIVLNKANKRTVINKDAAHAPSRDYENERDVPKTIMGRCHLAATDEATGNKLFAIELLSTEAPSDFKVMELPKGERYVAIHKSRVGNGAEETGSFVFDADGFVTVEWNVDFEGYVTTDKTNVVVAVDFI